MNLEFLQNTFVILVSFLHDLDPSLLQNIILGVLALLVPVGVAILSFFFEERSKGNIQANLELYILLKTVLKADKILIYSFSSLLLLSFYNINDFNNIISVLFLIAYFVWMLFVPFKNIWGWFLHDTKDFSISFLKGINILKNKKTAISSWQSLWLGEGHEENEKVFTQIFISHIDKVIKNKHFDTAIQLSQIYINNIEKRNTFLIGYEILPKVFEWNEIFWNEQEKWLRGNNLEKRIGEFFSQKHFPTFKKWTLAAQKKVNSKRDLFWNWNYFGDEFFKSTIDILLKDRRGNYQLFISLKKYVDDREKKLDEIEDTEEKEKYRDYTTSLFVNFCPTFFNQIDASRSSYSIWENDFPKEWKIVSDNSKNRLSRVFLREFLQWSQNKIFKNNSEDDHNKDLVEVISGIFPNVDASLFTSFLMIYYSGEIKYALEKNPNFYIIGTSISWSGTVEESDKERNKRLVKMMNEENIFQKNETLKIILEYFSSWPPLIVYKDDLSKKESRNWENYSEDKRKTVLNKVKIGKLKKIENELESDKITNLCNDSESKKSNRKDFLELINLLILEIEG